MLDLARASRVRGLIRRWKWIALAAVVASLVAVAWAASRPQSFVASVDLVTKRTVEVAPPGAPFAMPWVVGATPERRRALAALVRSPDVEEAVQRELSGALPGELGRSGGLLSLVSVRVPGTAELITISVQTSSADLATAIARAWAAASAREANLVYSVVDEEGIATQVEAARQRYETLEAMVAATSESPSAAADVAARVASLRLRRDAARDTYGVLLRRADEVRVASVFGGANEVAVGNDTPHVTSTAASVPAWALRGFLAGGLMAAVLAIVWESLDGPAQEAAARTE